MVFLENYHSWKTNLKSYLKILKSSYLINYFILNYFVILQVRTHFTRPNWNKVFTRICNKHPNAKVGKLACPDQILPVFFNRTVVSKSHG